MDMKKILQAMDGVSSKPAEGSDDMKKFLSVITEGANPHKVALPVQMAMNHYQAPKEPKVKKQSLLKKYFAEAEEQAIAELEQERALKEQRLKQYARKIADRVLESKESAREKWTKASAEREKKHTEREAKQSTLPAEHRSGAAIDALEKHLKTTENIENHPDTVTVDVPLLIRLLEYAREDAKTDIDLHNVAEKLIQFSQHSDTLTMDNYDAIVGDQEALPAPKQY